MVKQYDSVKLKGVFNLTLLLTLKSNKIPINQNKSQMDPPRLTNMLRICLKNSLACL